MATKTHRHSPTWFSSHPALLTPFMRGLQGAVLVLALLPHQWLQRPQEASELPAPVACHSQQPSSPILLKWQLGRSSPRTQWPGQAQALLCGPTQALPCALATLPIRWKPTRSQQAWPTSAVGSRRHPLQLKARSALCSPSSPQFLQRGREVRTGEETGSGRALCSRSLAPGDLGLLSTGSA